MANEKDLEATLVKEVRNTYFMEYRLFHARLSGTEQVMKPPPKLVVAWDGGRDDRGVVHKPVWPKIVKHAMQNGVSASDMIKAVFLNWKGNRPPLPNMMLNQESVELARQYKRYQTESLTIDLKSFRTEAARCLSSKERAYPDAAPSNLWRAVITEPTLTCSAMFRMCLACDLGQVDLAHDYWGPAMFEYIKCPDEYDTAYGKFIPPRFREEARRYLKGILSR